MVISEVNVCFASFLWKYNCIFLPPDEYFVFYFLYILNNNDSVVTDYSNKHIYLNFLTLMSVTSLICYIIPVFTELSSVLC